MGVLYSTDIPVTEPVPVPPLPVRTYTKYVGTKYPLDNNPLSSKYSTQNDYMNFKIKRNADDELFLFLKRIRSIERKKGKMDDYKLMEIYRNIDWSKNTEYVDEIEPSAPPLPPNLM